MDRGGEMASDVPNVPRRIPITTWASERDVNLLSLDRVRFESVPLIDGRDGARRRMSPQLAWEARRKHAPCAIPISPSWRMDCRYVRIEGEEQYVKRLWELTAANPRATSGDVSAAVICQDRPLLPLRWPPSGRKTENPEREFSQRGCYLLPGEQYARDSKYALYLSSLLAGQGDPGRFFEEIRKEQANRRHGLLVSWLHVEYYRVPPGMRSSLYPRVPQDWDEWEAPRGMNVPLPPVLVYRGSALLQGDPLHWCVFRTEWVIALFSRFVADAHHRGLLWRLPAKIISSVQTLTVETLLEGSPYRPEAVHKILKLQAEYDWEILTRAGYTSMQAIPLDRVGEEFKIYELPMTGVPERATGSEEGSDVEEILASGQVGTPAVPVTPPFPGLDQPRGTVRKDLTAGRERTSMGMASSWEVAGQEQPQYEAWTERAGPAGSSLTHMEPPPGGTERGQYRQPMYPSLNGEAYVTLDPYGGVRQVPVSDYIVVREVEEYLRYHHRWEDMREFTRDAPLTSETVGRALCALLESRHFHRHRGADLTRRIQALEEQQRTRVLLDQATAQTLRLLNTELNGLTERFHQQTVREADEIGGDVEEPGESESRKRARTGR